MATSRAFRPQAFDGPTRATADDIAELNQVFSESFTERYRRDGMVGVRVPFLNPSIWRYALEDAAEGAMIWRDDRDHIAAFNMVHRSGAEGWMGPLAVRTEYQGNGMGKEIVQRGVEWLKAQGSSVIGLETMPRTMDNIGFYSRLGFLPGRLTITMTLEAQRSVDGAVLFGRMSPRARDDALGQCRALVQRLLPGYDYSREITLTSDLSVGDTVLLLRRRPSVGFALAHTAPLVEGRVARGTAGVEAGAGGRIAIRGPVARGERSRAAQRNAPRLVARAGRIRVGLSPRDRARRARAVDRPADVAECV